MTEGFYITASSHLTIDSASVAGIVNSQQPFEPVILRCLLVNYFGIFGHITPGGKIIHILNCVRALNLYRGVRYNGTPFYESNVHMAIQEHHSI